MLTYNSYKEKKNNVARILPNFEIYYNINQDSVELL